MTQLQFRDDVALADLRTFASRARRLDQGAALRLVGHGSVLAVYACALHGGGGPTVLGLRTQELSEPIELDATVPAAAVLDRLADGGAVVPVPDLTAPDAAWAGVLPPRGGWSFDGLVDQELLRAAAAEGIAEVAAGAPDGAGAAAVARLRATVWGRPLPGPGIPAGSAFAADAFGFITRTGPDQAVTLHRAGPWWRLSTGRGHVLARTALLA
jgi:hypothetical protein